MFAGTNARRPPRDLDRLARAARPGDPREVDDAASRVDDAAVVGGYEALPGGPSAAGRKRRLDRVAKAGLRPRVGVQEQQEVAARLAGAEVAPGAEPEVGAGLDQPRFRREFAHGVGRAVGRVVVDDDQLVAGPELGEERRERPRHSRAAAIRDDDDREGAQPSASRNAAVSENTSARTIFPSRSR
jgi:hypothetical protein